MAHNMESQTITMFKSFVSHNKSEKSEKTNYITIEKITGKCNPRAVRNLFNIGSYERMNHLSWSMINLCCLQTKAHQQLGLNDERGCEVEWVEIDYILCQLIKFDYINWVKTYHRHGWHAVRWNLWNNVLNIQVQCLWIYSS